MLSTWIVSCPQRYVMNHRDALCHKLLVRGVECFGCSSVVWSQTNGGQCICHPYMFMTVSWWRVLVGHWYFRRRIPGRSTKFFHVPSDATRADPEIGMRQSEDLRYFLWPHDERINLTMVPFRKIALLAFSLDDLIEYSDRINGTRYGNVSSHDAETTMRSLDGICSSPPPQQVAIYIKKWISTIVRVRACATHRFLNTCHSDVYDMCFVTRSLNK